MTNSSKKRPTTIIDVARRVGLSHQVVSKILNGGSPNIGASQETRKRVLEAASELHYRPNRASRTMRRGLMQSVGIIMGDVSQFYLQQSAITSLSLGMSRNGYTTTLVAVEKFDAENILNCQPIRELMVDLLLISYVQDLPEEIQVALKDTGLPAVWLMRYNPIDSVYIAENQGALLLGRHLLSNGHRRLVTFDLSHSQMSPILYNRLHGLSDLSQEFQSGITHHIARIEHGKRAEYVLQWLRDIPKPISVIVHSIFTAQLLVQAAIHLGLRIPDDIALASFDQGTTHLTSLIPITCALRSDADFGFAAAEMALEKIRSPSKAIPSKAMEYRLFQGETTFCSNPK